MLGNLLQDLRYALRQLRKSPGFTLTVVLMLALGIGANTAVFSVMNAVLMQWLPVSHPEGLTYVRMSNGQNQAPGGWNTGNPDSSFTEATFEALRRRSDVFEGLIGYAPLSTTGNVAVRAGGLPEEAEGEEVSGNFFSDLGARIGLGRGFSLEEERNHAPIAILSYDYWTTRFSRNPAVIAEAYPNLPLEKPMSEQAQFEKSFEQQRMFAAMGGFFGVLAALLVATGLYGTYSFRVSQRTTEIGVRMALGASRARVLAMVIGESLWVLLWGLEGVPLTLMAARPLKSMLYQMSPFDPASFALAIAAMIFVSVSAAWLPARRAASIEPMQALRSE
jgi:hypothetical protein